MADEPLTLPKPSEFLSRLSKHPHTPTREFLQPYLSYEAWLRKAFARGDAGIDPFANLVPVYDGHESSFKIRNIDRKTADKKKYLMPLSSRERETDGEMAIMKDLREYKKNFRAFTHETLAGIDWSNVVVAGSSALLPLLSRRKDVGGDEIVQKPLETYYQTTASTSDVDIFLYGLDNDDVAIQRIIELEAVIRKNQKLLPNTGLTLRSKNAITFISPKWPYRHIQIILRLYRSISEILTGFDVDCACVAFDGNQVYSNPRGIAAIATRTNSIDLSRRSPSYENRLWKYRNHNFDVFWSSLDRSRIDWDGLGLRGPMEFIDSRELTGLARLVFSELVLETNSQSYRYRRTLKKMDGGGDPALSVPSGYATHVVPYSPRYSARKVYEYVMLHSREPKLFGKIKDVALRGAKPNKTNKGQLAGKVVFIKDNPGRQMIGSFHPLTEDDWTEMAYKCSDDEDDYSDEEYDDEDEDDEEDVDDDDDEEEGAATREDGDNDEKAAASEKDEASNKKDEDNGEEEKCNNEKNDLSSEEDVGRAGKNAGMDGKDVVVDERKAGCDKKDVERDEKDTSSHEKRI